MVFQNPVLFNASVYENVAYSLKFRGVSGSELCERVLKMLEAVQLNPLAKEMHRLSLEGKHSGSPWRALVYDPALMLLDEPTANLDPANTLIIENALRDANLQGKTIILVTHNIFQAKRLAGWIALLLEGEIIEEQDAPSFFSNPIDPRTMRFINGDIVY